MALVKLEVLPLPDLREIGERLWFKIKLDSMCLSGCFSKPPYVV